MIISISGPVKSGKSTILTLLKDSLPDSTIYVEDFYVKAWEEILGRSSIERFTDITKDRDYMCMYISKLCDKYTEAVKLYNHVDELVVFECCYLDHLIYSQLNMWYHYPFLAYQEEMVLKFLKFKDAISKVYMTTANDLNYPIGRDTEFEYKTSKVAFTRNRGLELTLYDVYRDNNKVVTLPSNTLSCDKIILDDLKELIEV